MRSEKGEVREARELTSCARFSNVRGHAMEESLSPLTLNKWFWNMLLMADKHVYEQRTSTSGRSGTRIGLALPST